VKFSCFTIERFSLYFYCSFLKSLGFHLVYFLMVITDFLIQIQHLWVVLLWKFKKRWWVVTLVSSISPCIFKFWVKYSGLLYWMIFLIHCKVEVVAVSTISIGYCITYTSLVFIWEVLVVLNFFVCNLNILLSNSCYLLLVLFNHSAYDRLGTQVNVSIIKSFSIHSCQALVNRIVNFFGFNVSCIEYQILSSKQMLWRCWSECCFLGLEHLITIMQQTYFLSLIQSIGLEFG